MFTGIVSAVSQVKLFQKVKGGARLYVFRPKGWRLKVGQSLNVSGVCSTVKNAQPFLEFDYMPETLRRTNLGELGSGNLVNLEQSLKLGDGLDGHWVLGHVDCVGQISLTLREGNSRMLKINFPKKFANLVKAQGSVAVEGVSLTVVKAGSNFFTVKIIPYTWQHTNLRLKKVYDRVNIEFDVLAKYVSRLVSQ